MNFSQLLSVCCISFFCTHPLLGQEFDFKREIDPFVVLDSQNENIGQPFLGGFNAPRPQFVDINGDDDLDLLLQEQSATFNQPGTLMLFENAGSAQDFDYRWVTDEYSGLDVGNWFQFVDVDGDTDFDLFVETRFGVIRFLRNTGSRESAEFSVEIDTLRDVDGGVIFFDIGSMPIFADIDCDTDLDLFIGRQAAGTITFYEGLGLDNEQKPQLVFVTNTFQDISIIGEGLASAAFSANKTSGTHGSNALSIIDIDNDQDSDFFWGDLNEPGIVYLQNSGSCQSPDISITTRDFPFEDALSSSGFNVVRFGDVDGDQVYDMFVGVLGGAFSSTSHLAENFYYYHNVGSMESPAFNLQTRQFISTIDIGSHSIPTFVDIDGDSDLDLFLANEIRPNGGEFSQIVFYRNTGSPNAPEFRLEDDNFLDIQVSFNYVPVFVDIDNDEDLDMFFGDWNGRLNFIENEGDVMTPRFEQLQLSLQGIIRTPRGDSLAVIDVGNNNVPAFADIDDDGDQDLFMGQFLGRIFFYENEGSPTSPTFVQVTRNYSDINVMRYSVPHFVNLDNDDDLDLLVGSDDQGVVFYRNAGSRQSAEFREESFFEITTIPRSAPVMVDLDGDSDLDFISGSERGGLLFYENQRFVTNVDDLPDDPNIPTRFALLQNYPNPFNPATSISYTLPQTSRVKLIISNILGQTVRVLMDDMQSAGIHTLPWYGKDERGRDVTSGIYFYQIRADDFVATRRMLLLK